jgi:hypothetical protein
MLVVSFCAGVLLWMNFGLSDLGPMGWPFHYYSYDWTYMDGIIGGYHVTPTQGDLLRVALDIMVGAGILACIALTCEAQSRKPKLDPLSRLIEILCVLACFIANESDPLGHYVEFRDSWTPILHCILSWLIITFVCVFISEAYARRKLGPQDEGADGAALARPGRPTRH